MGGQSGGIIDTLGDLLEKAESQLSELRNKETASLHEFQALKQSLEDKIKYETKELAEAKQGIAASNEKKATAEGDLDMTSKNLAEDVTALSELHHECLSKAQDYEAETKSRGEELKAIATAKKVIQETTAGAADLSYGLNQEKEEYTKAKAAMEAGIKGVQLALKVLRDYLLRTKHMLLMKGEELASSGSWRW